MTIRQLKELYTFANLEYSTDSDDLARLKKILLLELKSSTDGTLQISDTKWSKNDIITFFEGTLVDSEIDLQALEVKVPDLLLLRTPMQVVYQPDFKGLDMNGPELTAYGVSESDSLFSNYKRAIKSKMDDNYFSNVNFLLAYLPLFEIQKQFEISRYIKALFNSKFVEITSGTLPKKHDLYQIFSNAAYYKIILKVANDDIDFTTNQLLVFESTIPKMKWLDIRKASDRQMDLNHIDENYVWLESLKKQSYSNVQVEQGSGRSSGGFNVAWAVIVAIIFLVRLGGFFSSSNSRSTPNTYEKIYQNNPHLQEQIDKIMRERKNPSYGIDTTKLNKQLEDIYIVPPPIE